MSAVSDRKVRIRIRALVLMFVPFPGHIIPHSGENPTTSHNAYMFALAMIRDVLKPFRRQFELYGTTYQAPASPSSSMPPLAKMHRTLDDLRCKFHLLDTVYQHEDPLDTTDLIHCQLAECRKVAREMYSDIEGRLETVDAELALLLVCSICRNLTLLGLSPGDQRGKFRFLVQRILEVSAMLRAMNLVEAGNQGGYLWLMCSVRWSRANICGIKNCYIRLREHDSIGLEIRMLHEGSV